eukprot:3676358-Amphidinium_carterae.1
MRSSAVLCLVRAAGSNVVGVVGLELSKALPFGMHGGQLPVCHEATRKGVQTRAAKRDAEHKADRGNGGGWKSGC